MKKLLSLTLSSIFIAGSFVSCSTPAKSYSPKITVSSSDAVGDAEYLTNRLGNLTDNVHLSVGSDEFDMTSFENDGYIIRSSGGEAVVIGKTSAGLTNGVRKYANYAESGTAGEIDISYHEGYRVEKFTLAGVDISEYAIEYPESYNENMKFAVDEFIQLTEKACGVKLSSSVGITHRKYAIEFRQTSEERFRETGYRYFFEGSRFIIEGAEARGCSYGVWRFMKDELNWLGLVFNDSARKMGMTDSVLSESEHIDIPADRFREEIPTMDYLCSRIENKKRVNDITVPTDKQIGFTERLAHHGMSRFNWAEGYGNRQICYTDEDIYSEVLDNIREYIKTNIAVDGGFNSELACLDIAQSDNSFYCDCIECLRVTRKENSAVSGTVVRFANRISDDIAEDYSGISYRIFAYTVTKKPCKTAPRDNIYVTLCYDGNCANHPLDTNECPNTLNWGTWDIGVTNSDYAAWTRGWCDLSDNIYIWYYYLEGNISQYTLLDVLYDDMKFLMDVGVAGVQFECQDRSSLGERWFSMELVCELNWTPNMTREQYYGYLCRILEKEFGDGWHYIYEYINIWRESQKRTGNCWNCWSSNFKVHIFQHDYEYLFDVFDECMYLFDRATQLACDSREIRNCELFSLHAIYEGCLASFFREYDEGDADRIEELAKRYDLMISRMKKYGIDCNELGCDKLTLYESIYEEAWNDWAEFRESLPHGDTLRPAPEE